METYKFLVPSNFDVDAHIIQNPTNDIPHFKKEKLLYLLHIITEIPARNKDLNCIDGYVPLYTPVLHDMIGDRYFMYLRYLVRTGVLDVKAQYSAGNSRGYRFAKKYRVMTYAHYEEPVQKWLMDKLKNRKKVRLIGRGRTPVINLETRLPMRRVDMSHAECAHYEENMRNRMPYAYKWYEKEGLRIDMVAANRHNRIFHKYRQTCFIDEEARWNRRLRRLIKKDALQQYQCGLVNFLDIENKDYKVRFDANVFRMYSVLTSIPKEYRAYITWEGQTLVAVDICNSQPYLLAALLNPEFWSLEWENSPLSIHTLPYSHNYIKSYPVTNLIMLSNFLQSDKVGDVEAFRHLVSTGKLYEYMEQELPARSNGLPYTRKEIKEKMFLVMFTDNSVINAKWAAFKRAFASLFPSIYSVMEQIQSMGNDKLPLLLQRVESYIMYHKVLPRIAETYPDLPVFTIHDSVVTLKGYEDKVNAILRDELLKATGLPVTCKHEYWDKDVARSKLFGYEIMYEYMQDCSLAGCG